MSLDWVPTPARAGAAAAVLVALIYAGVFAWLLAVGRDVEPDHALAQVAFQAVGIGLLVAFGSWILGKLRGPR